ncbi:unnamed protein product [Caenorhabditis angaria]|uniref:ACB domain-containing protein n=1 Tax=Caenorhabditis angaria TaxID=860376 RepID=A0A9P1IGY8_9PELO|nr:unnamed protein product [Caenorhabditis angaria]
MGENDQLFETAVFVVQNLPKDGPVKTSNDEKLNFYSLFKQATIGKCNVSKPGFYDIQGVYKWNSWNNLGEMSHEEAKQKYVQNIIEKIKNVQANYKTEEWMTGETFEVLGPKFEILGVIEPKKSAEVEGEEEEEKNEKKDETTTNSSICQLSDNEYADAIDDEQQSRSSSFTENRSIRRMTSPSLRSSCLRLERELKSITEQIENLGKAVESRHNILQNLLKKATVYVLVPRANSWKTIIFFIFWPFVAHLILKYFRWFMRLL